MSEQRGREVREEMLREEAMKARAKRREETTSFGGE
jgi:hypothetical protein